MFDLRHQPTAAPFSGCAEGPYTVQGIAAQNLPASCNVPHPFQQWRTRGKSGRGKKQLFSHLCTNALHSRQQASTNFGNLLKIADHPNNSKEENITAKHKNDQQKKEQKTLTAAEEKCN